ncbi:MAG: polysaccharide deacetylase family protein [Candidatus Tectimicrobiota bacterium]
MAERLPVTVQFCGTPFDRTAIIHTLRHLAMRVGWVFCAQATYRVLYVTDLAELSHTEVTGRDVLVLSSPGVAQHLACRTDPIPLGRMYDGQQLPFPHPTRALEERAGWIMADVIAGAYAVLNLWYERRTRPVTQEGWFNFTDDWWVQAGMTAPQPVVDDWLERLLIAARQRGWPKAFTQARHRNTGFAGTLVLTHDVDYLPTQRNRGLPRLGRALVRQTLTRRRVPDAFRILLRYAYAFPGALPYFALPDIARREEQYGVRSSFQLTVARHHHADPTYDVHVRLIAEALRRLHRDTWEVGLHGSYTASRTPGRLAAERSTLEQLLGAPVIGHRQHYLHFHPAQLFGEAEQAGFSYDSSVGYNDCSGPRAGTLFPYRPYNIEAVRPHQLWEIPFVVMDTTLATTYRFAPEAAWQHLQTVFSRYQGCVAIIWHQEQLSGLLDPGFDQLYYRFVGWAREVGLRLLSGQALLPELEQAWGATVRGDGLDLQNL